MVSRIASVHAAKLFAAAAIIDVDRIMFHLLWIAQTVTIALQTYAAWRLFTCRPSGYR